jgi:hypothetical protein
VGILKHYTWLQTVRACMCVHACVFVWQMHKMLLNFSPFFAACFGKGSSDDRFCAQSCWITLLRYMALNSVNTSFSIYNPNALEHKVTNNVVRVIEISVNLLLLSVY